ncbi:MAG: MauE/DoxX family redox-associated membrane protein [Kordiimonas sp.]
MLDTNRLKDAERIIRIFLIMLLSMSGVYKFMIGFDHFVNWYEPKFTPNAYQLPMWSIKMYLYTHPVIELVLATGLIFSRTRNITLYAYFSMIIVLMLGHFAIDEFHEVNGLFDYMFGGLLIFILPHHPTLWWRESPE